MYRMISLSTSCLRPLCTILTAAAFIANPAQAQVADLHKTFMYVRPAHSEPFWSVGTFEKNWRIYNNRIALVELVKEPSTFRTTWYSPDQTGISFVASELLQQGPVRYYSAEHDGGFIEIAASKTASIVSGTESIGRMIYGAQTGSLEINSEVPVRCVSMSQDGRTKSVIESRSTRDRTKSTESVQTYLPPVMFSHPLVALATYTEKEPDAYFDKDGNIILTTVAPFWGTIPFTDSLFDSEIGTKTYRTTKFNLNGDILWSVYAGPGSRFSTHAFADELGIYHGNSDLAGLYKTEGTFQPNNRGGYDGSVSLWSEDGRCLWSTYIGGKRDDYVRNIAVDSRKNIYLLIETLSNDIPIKNAIIDTKPNPRHIPDVALISLTPDGKELRWATYLSGVANVNLSDTTIPAGRSFAKSLKVDRDDNVYVAFEQDQLLSVVTTEGAYSRTIKSGAETILMKFAADGDLLWSTLVNSTASDEVFDMNFDSNNNVVLRISQMLYNSGTPAEQLPAIGIPGETLTPELHFGFVFTFDPQGKAIKVWAPFESDFEIRDVKSSYSSGSQLVSICNGIHRATAGAIYCTPNASVGPADRVKVVIAKTDDFISYDTTYASPALGSFPTQLDVFNDKILLLDQYNTPSSGACLTDTSWSAGTDAVRKLGYLVVLQKVVNSISTQERFDSDQKAQWTLFPTPASDVLHVRTDQKNPNVEVPISALLKYSLVTVAGEVIDAGFLDVVDHESTISVQNVIPGCYFLHITDNESIVASLKVLVN